MVQGASQQGSFTVERVPRQFKTARLDLGPFELSDAKRVVELAGDWDVARWTASIPHPYSINGGSLTRPIKPKNWFSRSDLMLTLSDASATRFSVEKSAFG
jgi:hypothetical protein